jgi:undecaprenyl-diphosphatase
MLETLAEIDRSVFYWINQGQRNPLFDTLMPFITGSGNWHIPILVAWTSLLLFGGGRGRTAALLVIPLITISDQTSSNFLKHAFERLRPCNTLPDVHLLVGCSGSFSMPSSHAANFGAAAIHFATFYPRLAPAFVTLAVFVAYSRVYVGVHYPFDTLAGLAVGLGAALVVLGFRRLLERAARRSQTQPTPTPSP